VIVDASFTGVSTQYLVRLPWEQQVVVFAQNLGLGERFPSGTPVDLAWDVEHTFALAGDPTDGTRPEDPVVDLRDRADSGATPLGAVAG
jgi:spermidine/putrescine transport system ATP-binding protein